MQKQIAFYEIQLKKHVQIFHKNCVSNLIFNRPHIIKHSLVYNQTPYCIFYTANAEI
jgi:hypothetical protein